ncbi:hypothetical protein [uncultured Microbacterium sp.]|uniref:hypothetical protein n=1 Tax=uncultured Microbacterium sp. TaxID=191216 RepID=UPI002603C963|nr:hypothetical protein [uncultured Microbacterium sp.]
MRVPIVFADANVLYSKTLRDWLFLLRHETSGELFTVASSNDVIAEVLYWIRKNNTAGPGHLTSRAKQLIEESLDEIVRDFPAGMTFPGDDDHDTHVHAAAMTCGATYLVTDDGGFHSLAAALPYEVHSADTFFQLIAENVPQAVDNVIRRQISYYRDRSNNKTLSSALSTAGCPRFAAIVHQHLQAMSMGGSTSGLTSNERP